MPLHSDNHLHRRRMCSRCFGRGSKGKPGAVSNEEGRTNEGEESERSIFPEKNRLKRLSINPREWTFSP
jgi:hypothetical protein